MPCTEHILPLHGLTVSVNIEMKFPNITGYTHDMNEDSESLFLVSNFISMSHRKQIRLSVP